MSSAIGFLRKHVINNPNCDLEEVLNDEEFLDELKIKDEAFLNYLSKHFEKILNYLLEKPKLNSNCHVSYRYPFLASELFSIDSDLIASKIFGNYTCSNINSHNQNLTKENSATFSDLPIFRLIFYFENFKQDDFSITTPGYIQNILANLSMRSPQKLQEIVITNQEKILEIYSNNIENDSIRQILLTLLTIQVDLKNGMENFNYNKNLQERYFTSCLYIVDRFLSYYLSIFFSETKKLSNDYFNTINQNDMIYHRDFLENLYNFKFKIKNIFILVFKFLKFVDLMYPNKLDDILLKIFQIENLKGIEKILFDKSDPDSILNACDIYIYEEFLFFFSYFLKISFNKKGSNREYLMNNFFIDDYEKIYNQNNSGNVNNTQGFNFEDLQSGSEKQQEMSQEAIEGQVLSSGENLSGKIDNLYSCSFNLEEKLNDSTKMFLLEFYFYNFTNFFNLVTKIKKFFLDYDNIKENNNIFLINKNLYNALFFKNAASTSYVYFLDFLIVLFDQNKKEFSLKKIIKTKNFPFEMFQNLIDDMLYYRTNVFIQIKILRIFELLQMKDNVQNKEIMKILFDEKIISIGSLKKILENIEFKNFIDLEKNKFKKISEENMNYAWLIKLSKILIENIPLNDEEKLEIFKENYNRLIDENIVYLKNTINDKFDLIIRYIQIYMNLIGSDLLIKEQQSVQDLKNAGDEEIVVPKEKNYLESEAFLFTSKKTIENSKKLRNKLKEMDV